MRKIGGLAAALLTSTLVVAGVGVAPSASAATTNKMMGEYETDGGAIVRWTNVLKRGEVFKVKDVRFKKVTFECSDLSYIRVRGKVVGAVKVDDTAGLTVSAPVTRKGRDDLRFSLRFSDTKGMTGTGGINGTVKRKGGVSCTAEGGSFNIKPRS